MVPVTCFEDDTGKVLGKSKGSAGDASGAESDSATTVDLFGCCIISVFQSNTADAWHVRLL